MSTYTLPGRGWSRAVLGIILVLVTTFTLAFLSGLAVAELYHSPGAMVE